MHGLAKGSLSGEQQKFSSNGVYHNVHDASKSSGSGSGRIAAGQWKKVERQSVDRPPAATYGHTSDLYQPRTSDDLAAFKKRLGLTVRIDERNNDFAFVITFGGKNEERQQLYSAVSVLGVP